MGGTIAAKFAAGAECVFILASLGEKSHCQCCLSSESMIKAKRREQFSAALAALGVLNPSIIELGLVDSEFPVAGTGYYAQCLERIAELLREVAPEEVYYPAKNDSHPDHKALSILCSEGITQSRLSCRELRYITWGWYLPSVKLCKELARSNVVKVDGQSWAERKQEAIDIYLKSPPAPCGEPYCGHLPKLLIEVFSESQEFFLSQHNVISFKSEV